MTATFWKSEMRGLAADVARSAPSPDTDTSWRIVGTEQGLDLVGLDPERGGAGGSLTDLAQLVAGLTEEAWPSPLLELSLAQLALILSGREPATVRTTTAFARAGQLDVSDGRVSGQMRTVRWADTADRIVVVTDDTVLELSLSQESVSLTPTRSLSGDPAADVRFVDASASELGDRGLASVLMLRHGLLTSAALLGSLRVAYTTTRAYVETREQFDRPLVKIKAVAAHLARMHTLIIQSEVALSRALEIPEDASPRHLAAVATARVAAAEAATEVAHLAHRLHGAMGITMEYPLHRHTSRLWDLRDSGRTQDEWALLLADAALSSSEAELWDLMTG